MHLSDIRILHYVEASQTASCHMKTYHFDRVEGTYHG